MEEGESSVGDFVSAMKSENLSSGELAPGAAAVKSEQLLALPPPLPATAEKEEDKEMMCPICMQIMNDVFLTACGHSFCYMCIVTHLQNKRACPCCSVYLTVKQLYPNFLLNKLLMKTSALQIARRATPLEQLSQAIQQGSEVSVKELESLLSLLMDKKRKMEQEEAESSLRIMLEFLQFLRKRKVEELNEVENDLQFIKEDISTVEKHRVELYRARHRYAAKMRMLVNYSSAVTVPPSLIDKQGSGIVSGSSISQQQGYAALDTSQNRKADARAPENVHRTDSDSQNSDQSGLATARKRHIYAQLDDIQGYYLQKRRHCTKQSHRQEERVANVINREGYCAELEDFQSVLSTFTQYSRLRVVAELRPVDLFHSANVVSSIEFDRDDEFFATAGVSRRIKVFDFSSVVNEPADAQRPVVEMSSRSKLSCLSWNKYAKNHIASSDYEGIVTIWDVSSRQSVMEYEEHEKRAWSVDFSHTDPSMLVSGSDDCKVKVWCTKQEASVISIDMKANICSVKYNPQSSFYIAVGSADNHIHYYDLRNIKQPLHIFCGHHKSVSYVKFLSNNELASASTDGTLRLWDVKENIPLRNYRGHTNEKNFVGLAVNSEYIACGSETNEVFVYHKAISKPAASHKFDSDQNDPDEDMGSHFISSVCWKRESPTILTANSQGIVQVLVLTA
ncbi:E3 ubiquitin-protein ligase COP1-like isoform X1 [Nicotiana sylvestris]|uniref:E3 ubiquitin-protein ligase COP1-like isoform X1 n=2 Tax=Nicotiana sylvestris TaxID=4096 RepID=UPI00388CA399